eukprot:GSChrysophyteH2.ASY1.ANO1.1354.1 assembled CDS
MSDPFADLDFGDFDASTPTLETFLSASSTPEHTPAVVEDDFEDFCTVDPGAAQTVMESPVVEMVTADAGDDNEEFGDFGVSSEPVAEPVSSAGNDEDDAFGDFGDAGDDDFGDFGEFVSADVGDAEDFGDFGGSTAPVVEPVVADSGDDNDFGDFGVDAGEDDADAFGDFGDFGDAGDDEDADFGDFGGAVEPAAEPVVESVADLVAEPVIAVAKDGNDFGGVAEPAVEPDAEPVSVDAGDEDDEDEDFGDFGGAVEPAAEPVAEPVVEPVAETVVADAGDDDADAFGDFGDAGDDDFGDFGGAVEPAVAPVVEPINTDVGDAEDEDFGDFGDFDGAVEETTPEATQSDCVSAAAADAMNFAANDDDFGDFDASPVEPTAAAQSASVVETEDTTASLDFDDGADDDFGDFGDAHTKPTESVNTPVVTSTTNSQTSSSSALNAAVPSVTTARACIQVEKKDTSSSLSYYRNFVPNDMNSVEVNEIRRILAAESLAETGKQSKAAAFDHESYSAVREQTNTIFGMSTEPQTQELLYPASLKQSFAETALQSKRNAERPAAKDEQVDIVCMPDGSVQLVTREPSDKGRLASPWALSTVTSTILSTLPDEALPETQVGLRTREASSTHRRRSMTKNSSFSNVENIHVKTSMQAPSLLSTTVDTGAEPAFTLPVVAAETKTSTNSWQQPRQQLPSGPDSPSLAVKAYLQNLPDLSYMLNLE